LADINQNFSIYVGDDMDVDFDIGPDTTGLDLNTAQQLTWKAYAQTLGVPDKTTALISKTKAAGITITDPTALTFTVHLAPIDSTGQSGNLYHEVKIVDVGGKVSTPTIGTMTVIDTADPINVVAFKSMFPELETVDDSALQTALEEAALFVDVTIWSAQDVTAGIFYLAAHFVFTAQSVSQTGGQTVSSERIGEIAVTYAVAASGSGSRAAYPSLSNSSYGLMYLSLMRRNSPSILVV
jgi:hypothetical protein